MKRFRRLSAPGASALSIWELEGAVSALRELFAGGLPDESRPLRLDRESLPFDEALLWSREGGAEADLRLECHLHGGHGVAAAFRAWLSQAGWQEIHAAPTAEEERLRNATSPLAAKVALRHLEGGFRKEMQRVAALPSEARAKALAAMRGWSAWGEVLGATPMVLLAGPPNSGKSTLLNLWQEAELVTAHPGAGTTRDAVSTRLHLGQGDARFLVHLVDSAGLGRTGESLEREAMDWTRELLPRAWRVLWVLDHAHPPEPEVLERVMARREQDLVLLNRIDLPAGWKPQAHGLSPDLHGHQGEGPAWPQRIEARLLEDLGPVPDAEAWVPLEEGQRRALAQLQQDRD